MVENETQTEEGKSEDTGKGDQPKTPKILVDANAAAERLEKANAETKELMARQALGGDTEAGQQPVKKVVESDTDYSKRIMAGDYQLEK